MKDEAVFKILPAENWHAACVAGVFTGSGIDLEDGYIHFSTASQVAETAALHFRHQQGLMLLEIAVARLACSGLQLVWEESRGGALFPHLYANLPVETVVAATPMPLDQDGIPIIPAAVTA